MHSDIREAVVWDTAAEVLADLADREPHVTVEDIYRAVAAKSLPEEEKRRVLEYLIPHYLLPGRVS